MKITFLCLMLLAVISLPALAAEPVDIAGAWLLTMPRGFEYDATLFAGPEAGLFRLKCGALNLGGLYELKGKRLTMVQPQVERMNGLVWEVKNQNTLVLVQHPEKSQFGADYSGATLGRQKKADAQVGRGGPRPK